MAATRDPKKLGQDRELQAIATFRARTHYTTYSLAQLLSCAPVWVAKMMDAGILPSWKVPGSKYRRVGHAELKAFLESNPDYWFYLERLEWAEKLAMVANGRVTG